jgi:hypothetical protein
MPGISSYDWLSFWGQVNARNFQLRLAEFLGAGHQPIAFA